ncbi:MAG: TolC family protein [Bacteroidetes bacterium]|nr:TolC family protein [Bacteroidota bacterium]
MRYAKRFLIPFVVTLLPFFCIAGQSYLIADTLRFELKDVERIFFEKNLQLLAQHYQVEADKAIVQQARLWDNPLLVTDQNIYSNHKFFEHSNNPDGTYNGQYYVQIQQLIKTAGKRGKVIKIAQTNAQISEWQFRDLMRNLKLQLRSDFYTIAQLISNQNLYDQQMVQLDKLLMGMKAQFQAGNVARKDLLRIQALQMSTQKDALDNARQLMDLQTDLKNLLLINGNVFLMPLVKEESRKPFNELQIDNLLAKAQDQNPEYHLRQLQLQYQSQNLALQKALSIPDVILSPNFDKNSNYTPNYWGLGISFDLPFLNRNQGNIKSAKWLVKAEETNLQQAEVELKNGVFAAYQKLYYTQKISDQNTKDFYLNYGSLYDNIVESYRLRQINLIEFIDYFEAYKETMQKEIEQKLHQQLAEEELNYQVGTDIL